MPVLSICPANFDIFIHHGDENPWTITLHGSNKEPLDVTGYTFLLNVDTLENPPDATTQVFSLTGTVTNGPAGVVEFELDDVQSATDLGRYYYVLHAVDNIGRNLVLAMGRWLFVDSCETNKVSDVDICNMALSFIGDQARVTSIMPPDASVQGELCAKFYPMALRSTLEMHNWAFATRRSECTPVGVEPGHEHDHDHEASVCDCAEWQYYYQLPRHFLKAIAVMPDESPTDYAQVENFTVQRDSTGTMRLYCNVENAIMLYTEYVVETHTFPPLFQMAVAWHLASMLAGAILKGDVGANESKRCLQMSTMYAAKATASDSAVRRIHPEMQASWITAR